MLKIKPPIFIVMGVCGCGKSTIGKLLAEALQIPFFDGDDYHPKANVTKMAAGNPLNDNDREGWLKRLNALAIENNNFGAVIACSALKETYRTILRQNISKQIEFVYLQGSYEEISDRLAQRKNHFMPSGLLKSQFKTLEVPTDAISVSIINSPQTIINQVLELHEQKKL